MTEKIFALAKVLGRVSAGDEDALRALCELAEEALRKRLREGVSTEDCGVAFQAGAAWLALAGICISEENVEGFTAGGLTVRQGDAVARSAALRQLCERVMSPYLEDDGFFFAGVRG